MDYLIYAVVLIVLYAMTWKPSTAWMDDERASAKETRTK
jgi:hypothetical protein